MSNEHIAPSIILIGGRITLDTGAQLDTRQLLEGDEWDFILRSAVGGSEAFWRRAKEIADLIMDASEEESPWAMAWVNKTVKRPKADGSFSRTRTVALLDNAPHLIYDDAEKVAKRSEESRYRIFPYILRFDEITNQPAPAAFIGACHTTYEDGTDLVGLRPIDEILWPWPGTVLILPHTPLIENKVARALAWHRTGRPKPDRDRYGDMGLAEQTHPHESASFVDALEKTAELRAADPHIIDHDLRVTYWLDQGVERSPQEFEAALDFTKARYDLDIGFWDLARDPVLRATLLDPADPSRPSSETVEVPTEVVESGQQKAADAAQKKQVEADARSLLHTKIWSHLESQGWAVPKWKQPGTEYRYPLGPLLDSLHPDGESESALFFAITIHKNQATLNLYAVTRIHASEVFLEENSALVEAITGRSPEPDKNVVYRIAKGGWSGDPDIWDEALLLIKKCVDVLVPNIDSLIDAAVAFRKEQLGRSYTDLGEIVITVETPSRPTRGSFLKRLFGG